MADRRHRSPARWLAPVAVVACAAAIYLVASDGLKSKSSADHPTSVRTRSTSSTVPASTKPRTTKRRYVVRGGDTLSGISVKTGVPLETIERLNPKIQADTLHAGQKVRLAP